LIDTAHENWKLSLQFIYEPVGDVARDAPSFAA